LSPAFILFVLKRANLYIIGRENPSRIAVWRVHDPADPVKAGKKFRLTFGREIMDFRHKPRIGVMGSASCPADLYYLAHEVGHLIGQKGAILICGGRSGIMEASAKGAREAGGITIGILPGDSAEEANPYIDIPIVTDLGNARNVINILSSQAVIAIHGSYGTLSEIALAMKCNIPVVGLRTWSLVPPGGESLPITYCHSAEEAVNAALSLISKKQRIGDPDSRLQ
jgi:uncharacterized protein (TIGR00725 family)